MLWYAFSKVFPKFYFTFANTKFLNICVNTIEDIANVIKFTYNLYICKIIHILFIFLTLTVMERNPNLGFPHRFTFTRGRNYTVKA